MIRQRIRVVKRHPARRSASSRNQARGVGGTARTLPERIAGGCGTARLATQELATQEKAITMRRMLRPQPWGL